MNLAEKFQQAFSNKACFDKFKEALDIDTIRISTSNDGIQIVFVKKDNLETLLLKPEKVRVGPKERQTQTGTQHVAGYTRKTSKTNTEDLIKAQESDTDIDEKTAIAFQQFIECCLESIDGQSITIE